MIASETAAVAAGKMCLHNEAAVQWKKIAKEPVRQEAADRRAMAEAGTSLRKATDLNKDS